jgi:hypothetical protein
MSTNNSAPSLGNLKESYPKVKDDTVNLMKMLFNNFFRSAPEGLLFGAVLLAVFTQNMAFFILGLAVLVFKLLDGFLGKFFLQILSPEMYAGEDWNGKCDFPFETIGKLEGMNSALRASAVPSSTTFIFLASLFYMLASVHKFKDTLDVLKTKTPAYASVLPVSFVLTTLLSLAYIVWRKNTGCDSISVLFITLAAAALFGPLVTWAFEAFFGKAGINLLNLPILEKDEVVVGDNVASCKAADT